MMAEKRRRKTNYPGKRFRNMDGYWYTVGERTGERKYGTCPVYEIVFDSGFRTTAAAQDIWRNQIKDWGSPSILGVGIVGWKVKTPHKHPLFSRWLGMLKRCYDGRDKAYENVTVCERWHRFDLFAEDAVKLPGYDPDRLHELTLDKDRFGTMKGKWIYSPETCCWLTMEEQLIYRPQPRESEAPQCPYRGVHWTDCRWLARPTVTGREKRPILGYFKESLDAALTILRTLPDYYRPDEVSEIVRDAGLTRLEDTGVQKAA